MIHSIDIPHRTTPFLIAFLILAGCGSNYRTLPTAAIVEDCRAPKRYCTLFCLRQAGYAGQGRIHTLKIDNHPIGALTPDNYYRIALWPGSYTFTVHLPEETFLGETSRAISLSKRILLRPEDVGQRFVLQYMDGMSANSFAFSSMAADPQVLAGRTLTGSVGLHDTAKVLELFDGRYEGPSRHGNPHGWGTLTWPDGCVYQGIFEYGEPTTKGLFFFPQGEYFRGFFREGRPYRSGLLFAQDGSMVFAGRFIDEKPHGQGIRLDRNGPQFCVYDHGKDITKAVKQQAQASLNMTEADQAVARERKWCQSEFARNRRWCQCAPFADDYLNWTECLPQ